MFLSQEDYDPNEDMFEGLSDDNINRLSELQPDEREQTINLSMYDVVICRDVNTSQVIMEKNSTFDLTSAEEAMKNKADPTQTSSSTQRLYPDKDNSDQITGAYVKILDEPHSARIQTFKNGDDMPYVKMDNPPSPKLTIQLHGLSSEQSLSFLLIVDTLQRHLDGENTVPQLLLQVMGNAGG